MILPFIQNRYGIQSVVLASAGWIAVCISSIGYSLNGGK